MLDAIPAHVTHVEIKVNCRGLPDENWQVRLEWMDGDTERRASGWGWALDGAIRDAVADMEAGDVADD